MSHAPVAERNTRFNSSLEVLALTRYQRLGASSRLRWLQYMPALAAAGIRVQISPLLNDAYVSAMYEGRKAIWPVLCGYANRVAALVRASRFDLVWIEKECLPWIPACVELGMMPRSCKLVADYDDAWFHRYDRHRSALARQVLGRKIDAVMKRVDLVTAGNSYLAEHARAAGALHVEWLPTVVDVDRYPGTKPLGGCNEVVVGWIGSPGTASRLSMVAPVLEELCRRHRVRCIAIGARPDQVEGTAFEAVPWSEVGEAEAVAGIDIGIMPLTDDPWERGKCGYKLIQYMACGVPVVASAVGANLEIVVPGENGELVRTPAEWSEALERLIVNPDLRERMGAAGRKRVESVYSLQCQAPRLVGMLQALVAGKA